MKIKAISGIALFIAVLSGCRETTDLGNGFYLLDQGGSKTSIAKDGIIIISYTVTGVGRAEELTVIESREHYSETCIYHIIDHTKGGLFRIDEAHLAQPITLEEAAQSIKPINSRSCKHNVRGSSRGL